MKQDIKDPAIALEERLMLSASLKLRKLLFMSFCIHCHLLDEIPVAEILCLFCFALMKRNWTAFVIVSYYERKLHYSLFFEAKRRERVVSCCFVLFFTVYNNRY